MTAPPVSRWRSEIPAATSRAVIVKPMTSAVPRSGWDAMSSTAAPTTIPRGASSRGSSTSFGVAARTRTA
jgi:hypothetical protein